MKKLVKIAAVTAAAALALAGCSADNGGSGDGDVIEYPTKAIKIVVPWAPGGSGDLTARSLQPILAEELGVEVIVENMPGANGTIAYYWLTDQPADGYNFSLVGAEISTLQFLDYDDVKPEMHDTVAQATQSPGAIAVPFDSPYETLQDLIDAAKAAPGQLSFSNPGPGSIWDATGNGFMDLTGTDFKSVPFDGETPAVQAAAQGDVDFTIAPIATIKPRVDDNLLRYLGTLTDEVTVEGVPTAKEQGVDLVNASFIAINAPKGTPLEIREAFAAAVEKATQDERFTSVVENVNVLAKYRDPSELETFLKNEAERYSVWIR